jgi:cytochrome P450
MPSDSDYSLSLVQLLDPSVIPDPHIIHHRIRSAEPVHWDVFLGSWVVTTYDGASWVLKNLSVERFPDADEVTALGLGDLSPIVTLTALQMLFLDPPRHTRIRKLVGSAFTPDRVAGLAERIKSTASRLLSQAMECGKVDIVRDFAIPLPGMVVALMLGVPEADAPQLGMWANDIAETFGNFTQSSERTPRIIRSCIEITNYFHDCIYERKSIPKEGLLHALVTAEVDGDRLAEEEVISNAIGILVGGQETATNLISTGLFTLLNHPEQLEAVRENVALIAPCVEELLRFNSPVQLTARVPKQDLELGGKKIRAGQPVIAVLGAANCDPARFPDPDALDLKRSDNRHLAFGWATHFCLGSALARLEMRIALELLLSQRGLRFEPEEVAWRTHLVLRGLSALPVSFD